MKILTEAEVCRTKIKYLSKGEAKAVGRKRSGSGLLHYYKCPVCAAFHLTKLAKYKGREHGACI